MILRQHTEAGRTSEAAYSDCGAYRYWLKRRWAAENGVVNFIMLNPSVADEVKNDPTVERCERRARQWGYGAFCVTNIFAWRDTHPEKMRRATAPVGPENDAILLREALASDLVVAAWGTHGAHRGRGPQVAADLARQGVRTCHLGLSKEGHPRHPLYVPYSVTPIAWSQQRG